MSGELMFGLVWLTIGWLSTRALVKRLQIGPFPLWLGIILTVLGPTTFIIYLKECGSGKRISRFLFGDGSNVNSKDEY